MVRGLSGCSLVIVSLLAAPAHAGVQTGAPVAARSRDASPFGFTAARHPERDVPSLLWAASAGPAPAGATPEQAARFHLERVRNAYRAPRGTLDAARLLFVHDTGRGGIIVALRQTLGGVDLVHGDIKVLLGRDHRLVAIAGSPHPGAAASHASPVPFASTSAQVAAVAVALRDRYGLELGAHLGRSREPARAGHEYLDLAVPGPVDLQLRRPARVKPVYFPVGDTLVAAHRVEIQAERGRQRDALAWIVATDGRILERRDLTAHESFNYRVYADDEGRPLDGPLTDYTPHPLGEPAGGPTEAVAQTLVAMEGFNHNPDDLADPWLPPGATETLGNNVDAYADHVNPSGLSGPMGDFRAVVSSPGSFDYTYDITLEPLGSKEQSMAAVTSLFYVTNWMHDWWYDSGFNEAAGNGQADNFGRGGAEGDPMRAEGQDGVFAGARDNANMQTPEDGESPIMQMFLWSPLHKELHFGADPPGQDFAVGQATFGPRVYDVEAPLVLIDDGMGKSPTDGCEPPLNDLAGKIALIDRGTCSFELKATHAQAAGALGVVFPDSLPNMDAYPPGPPDIKLDDPTIPGQGLSKADGEILKAALLNGPVTGHMVGNTSVERDGTIDNMIVAHEWGHFLHLRIVDCGSVQCGAQSEGWGDFNGLMLALREGDDLDATYAYSYYGTFDTTAYRGGRRVTYSVDPTKNALSFRHIAHGEPLPPPPLTVDNGYTNAEVHNAGEVWATMMWEAYVGLHQAHAGKESFDATRRRMSDYIVAGMMMAPPRPTYTEQRDAILAAAFAADPADHVTIAEAFARRGAGTCAVSPDTDSFDLVGVVEDFEVRARGVLLSATIDDATLSCDQDGVLDGDETGKIAVTVRNAGVAPMVGATLKASPSTPTLVFPDGDSLMIPDLAPQTEVTLGFAVALSGAPASAEPSVITLELTAPNGCAATTEIPLPAVLNADLDDASSKVDDVETTTVAWSVVQPDDQDVWSRIRTPGGHAWHADNLGVTSDTKLESPPLEVAQGEPFTVSFAHAHSFETSPPPPDPNMPMPPVHFDGGVVEISTDNGMSWIDISIYTPTPGYPGGISAPTNVLHGRGAFVGKNPSYPERDTVTLDFGDAFAGKTIALRFRVGTDNVSGAPGWDIDDIVFSGITNTPFASWVADVGSCDEPEVPTTSAGSSAGETGDTPTTSGGDGSGSSSGGPMEEVGDDDGCGCNTTSPAGLLPLLALLGLRRRRRFA